MKQSTIQEMIAAVETMEASKVKTDLLLNLDNQLQSLENQNLHIVVVTMDKEKYIKYRKIEEILNVV